MFNLLVPKNAYEDSTWYLGIGQAAGSNHVKTFESG